MAGKHHGRTAAVAFAAALALAFPGAEAAWGFMTCSSNAIANRFSVADCRASIAEEFEPPAGISPGDRIAKKISVRNDGSTPCFVRARVCFSDETCADWVGLDFDDAAWKPEKDGFRYYSAVLQPGETSPPICTEAVVSPDASQAQIHGFQIIAFCESTPVSAKDGSPHPDAQAAFAGRKE